MKTIQLETNNGYSALRAPEAEIAQLFQVVENSGEFPITPGELSVALVDDATIAKIHADFMDDPTPTDVITFPANQEMKSAGEIIVSVDHAIARAQELELPFSRELSLYLIHGWLHLAGYDDRNETDRAAMRAAEARAIQLLAAAGCGASFELQA